MFLLRNLLISTLIFGVVFIEGKSKGKKKSAAGKKEIKRVFPSAPKSEHRKESHSTKSNARISVLPDLKFLHKEKEYDRKYLSEYKKMIRSLLPEAELYENYNNPEFLVLPHETKTDKSLYSPKMAKLPVCSAVKEKNWEKLKVLQLEKKNSVTLKQNSQTGAKVVEKAMQGDRHYVKEMNFFRHAHHGSTKYFPSFICSAKPKSKRDRYSIITDFVDGEKSHLMAAKATAEQLKHMVAQFFNSVVELHKVGFIHCDLTPANVMVTRDFEVKLIDFGMALPIGEARGFRGSFYTRAPELHELVPGKIDVGIDWWAFGCTVAMWYYYHFNPEATNQTDATYAFTPMKLGHKKKLFSAGVFPSEFPKDLRKFLGLFLTIDPEMRTFSTIRLQNMIRNHEFFNGFDWSTAEKY